MTRNKTGHHIGVKSGLVVQRAGWSLCYDLYHYYDLENGERWAYGRDGTVKLSHPLEMMEPTFTIGFDVERETHFFRNFLIHCI